MDRRIVRRQESRCSLVETDSEDQSPDETIHSWILQERLQRQSHSPGATQERVTTLRVRGQVAEEASNIMNQVIILEGPDGAGKSHLADKLQDEYRFAYIHNGLYPHHTRVELMQLYFDQIRKGSHGRSTVIDRSFVSEFVYGQVMRQFSRFTQNDVLDLRHQTEMHGVIQILCLPPVETVINNWRVKRQTYVGDYVDALDKIRAVYRTYTHVCSGMIVWDYTKGETETQFLDRVLQCKLPYEN